MRNCTRCYVKLKKLDIIHLMKGTTGTISIPAYVYVCPNCGKLEMVKIE